MVKVTGTAREVEVEVEVSIGDVIDELIGKAHATRDEYRYEWQSLVVNAITILEKVPPSAIASLSVTNRDILARRLAELVVRFADGVAIDDDGSGGKMLATPTRDLPLGPGFYMQAVEPRAIDIAAVANAIADDLFTSGLGAIGDRLQIRNDDSGAALGGWSKAAVISRVIQKLREARK